MTSANLIGKNIVNSVIVFIVSIAILRNNIGMDNVSYE